MAEIKTVAVFADTGVSPHQVQYRQAGSAIARKGARVVCVAHNGDWPRAVVDSALAEGGSVAVVTSAALPGRVPRGVEVISAESGRQAGETAAQMSDAIIGLPGNIDVVAMLYAAWVDAGGAQSGKPVALLNHRKSFEIVKGFVSDVAHHGRGNTDKLVQFADTIDDLWSKLTRG